MPAVTDYTLTLVDGPRINADAHGNNVAFNCISCSNPILAVMLVNQRGSSETKPTYCKYCGAGYWLEIDDANRDLKLFKSGSLTSGRLKVAKSPSITALQNAASWQVIQAICNAYGSADFEDLVSAVSQHNHPNGGRGFILYCIRNGWLTRA